MKNLAPSCAFLPWPGPGAAGATARGRLGVMVGAGIPETRAKLDETELKSGGIVFGVTPKHDDDASFLESEWKGTALPR